MNKLQKNSSITKTKIIIDSEAVKISLIKTAKRMSCKLEIDANVLIRDIEKEFEELNTDDIIIALRNGGLAKYGVYYKLTDQVIFWWIRKYKENRNSYKPEDSIWQG